MRSAKYLLLLMVLVALPTVIESQFQQMDSQSLFKNMPSQSMKIHNDLIYVGVMNKIISFDKDLNQIRYYNTCQPTNEEESCENRNKLMILNDRTSQLITCGTGQNGICELLGLPDLNVIKGANESTLRTSVDSDSPAIGLITSKGNLTIALTNGPTASGRYIYSDSEPANEKHYAISKRKFSTLELWSKVHIKMSIDKDFSVKYKDGFHHETYSYFVTNQNKTALGSGGMFISKLVRVCENDPKFFGYVDIELGCADNDGNDYNLIQHIMKAEDPDGKVWFIGIFNKGNNLKQIIGDSVICAATLTEVNDVINTTWHNFFECKNKDMPPVKYLEDLRPVKLCSQGGIVGAEDNEFKCENEYESFYYNIGLQKLNMSYGYKLESTTMGIVSATFITNVLDGRTESGKGKNSVIILGTSRGKLINLNMKFNGGTFKISKYLEYSLENAVPVTSIQVLDKDTMYVLNKKRIYKFITSKCSEFETCKDTMKGENPLCGWCVLQNRATRREDCASGLNEWLSALDDKCPSFIPQPSGVKLGTSKQITLSLANIPVEDVSAYKCNFTSNEFIKITEVTSSNKIITCQSPNNVDKHVRAQLELSISGVTVASSPFMFYRCEEFKKCGECVSDGNECKWDTTTLQCGSSGIDTKDSCPALFSNENYISSGVSTDVILNGKNLNISSYHYKCQIGNRCFDATSSDSTITCTVELDTGTSKPEKQIILKYGVNSGTQCSNMLDIEDEHSNKVVVYNCSRLVDDDCSRCCALNKTRYKCNWNGNSCAFSDGTQCNLACPAPIITELEPKDGPYKGGTNITLQGKNFGHLPNDKQPENMVLIDGKACTNGDYVQTEDRNEDYQASYIKNITCTMPAVNLGTSTTLKADVTLQVYVTGNRSSPFEFTYKKPIFLGIKPEKGIKSGQTRITLYGENLIIGNKKLKVFFNENGETECTDIDTQYIYGLNSTIFCSTGSVSDIGERDINVEMDTESYPSLLKFTYTEDPKIDEIEPKRGIISGGTRLTVYGSRFENVQNLRITINDYAAELIDCYRLSDSKIICPVPKVPDDLKKDILDSIKKTRKKRSTESDSEDEACEKVTVILHLDGLEHNFDIKYCRDPELEKFNDGVLLYGSDDQQIKIKGKYLTLAARDDDYNVTVGVSDCPVISVKKDEIICEHDHMSEDANTSVIVSVGNIKAPVGRIEYRIDIDNSLIIAGAASAGVVFLFVIIVIIVCVTYRRVIRKKDQKFKDEVKAMEMKIIDVAKQEFLEMHTTMSSVNKNLVEQGFPYHSYQQYACNVMFAMDYLLTEPVMMDDERFRAKKGLEALEALISNKFFLVSVIGTMENQKKFFIREKSNLAGNLCAILMGRMEYVSEVLCELLPNLVKESSGKKGKQKALFRRCESITEKLLSNWLSLCLYLHFMNYSGSPLYLLYIALQKTIEAGPIDAVTGDTKYTLSEEKLLKKNSCTTSEEDLKFECKTLTLNVVINDDNEIHKCKVLDCDTITQVKCKCLSQIYVNYPASKLDVDTDDIILEWHEGFGGKLKLQDHDSISVQERNWVRLNTLKHYNVKDDSSVALVDPHSLEAMQQEDYVNLTSIQMDVGGCNGSMDSTDPLTLPKAHDEELTYWHLVRKEEENTKQEKSVMEVLYLNKLFTTKLSVKDYIKSLFDIILDKDNCPPPTKFLLDFLDELGEKNKVDNDTIHNWKSHSYAIRIWAALMKTPSILFDVNIPSYMNDNLDVISQVFIESFSLSSQKFTKDSPSQKTVFHHEMNECRERALEFYKNVKVDQQNQEELRQYLSDVNRLQQQTNFNKTSALHRVYKQLEPYLNDIVEDLATCKTTSNLQLDKKLESVIAIMNEGKDD